MSLPGRSQMAVLLKTVLLVMVVGLIPTGCGAPSAQNKRTSLSQGLGLTNLDAQCVENYGLRLVESSWIAEVLTVPAGFSYAVVEESSTVCPFAGI